MINHEYLELFNQSSIKKDIDIAYDDSHITNDDVVSGSFSLNESAFATKELRFGSLVSSQMSVKLFNTVPNLMDKELNISMVVDNITSNPLKIGKYKVLEDKPTTDRLYKQIKAYDALYEVINKNVVDWYEGLSFPLTQKVFRDSFFNYIGITQVDIILVNDDMLIEKTITANTISGQQVLSAICELNGAIGRMNRDGNFEYVILEVNPTDRITIDKIQSKSGNYEDFDCQPISKVQIRQTTDDIGTIVGEDGNTYIMQDNFLVYGKSASDLTTIATNLLSVIKGITYTPFNIKAIYGNPCYEIGDAITVVTRNKTFNSYIFNRTLKGIQAINDTIKADGVEYYTENLNSANVQMQQLKRQTNELSRTVEETRSTITSIETVANDANNNAQEALDNVGEAYDKATEALDTVGGFDERITKNESSITQNAKEIELKVSVGDVSSQLSVENEQVTISGNRLVVDADNFKLDANGSTTCNDMIITGGQVDVIAETGYQSKVSVTSKDGTMSTSISPLQIVMNRGDDLTQINSVTGGGYYALSSSNGDRIVQINPGSLSVGVSATSATSATYFTANSAGVTSSGKITAGGELQSTTANGLRIVAGNYGFLIRNDGNHIYFMLTNSGDQYGGYNSLRPLYISNSTGAIGMGNSLTVGGGLASSGVSYLNGGLRVGDNGVAIKFMRSGSTVLAGVNSSARIFLTDATIKSWYSSYKNGNTAVFISNGDSGACNAHFESATYASNTQGTGWFVVASSSIASTTNMRINWTIMCW